MTHNPCPIHHEHNHHQNVILLVFFKSCLYDANVDIEQDNIDFGINAITDNEIQEMQNDEMDEQHVPDTFIQTIHLKIYPFENDNWTCFDITACLNKNDTYVSYMTVEELGLTLPSDLNETNLNSSVYCNEMAYYFIKTWMPYLMVMVIGVLSKLFNKKLPKTNNVSKRANNVYGNDIDELKEPQREDLLIYSILGPKFETSFPNSHVKFTKAHWTFLHSSGRKGQHLPKYKGDYFNIVSQLFKSQINKKLTHNQNSLLYHFMYHYI